LSSTHDDSPGTVPPASPRYSTAEKPHETDALGDLIARSEAAVAHLLASTDWVAHDALIDEMADQSARAADALLAMQPHDTPTTGTVSIVRHPRSRRPMTPVPVGIHASDVVALLKDEGLPVQPWSLRYAARRQRIPQPFLTRSGDHAWSPDALPAIRCYFQNPIRPGRPRKPV
jgi:hypothetical protein